MAVTPALEGADTLRAATLERLYAVLRDQQDRKVDLVAPAGAITVDGNELVIQDAEGGVHAAVPTEVCDTGIAEKLGIPGPYLRRMRREQPGLAADNIRAWLRARPDRRFLIRCFRGADGGPGVGRAWLSDHYKPMDNLDVLVAALQGLRDADVDAHVQACDLTDRRMYVQVVCPQVAELAPVLLDGYRSPFTGAWGADNPVVFAGFLLTNSETGHGRATMTPRLVVEVCDNGVTITKDAFGAVHLGGRLDDGPVRPSADTRDKHRALIAAKARDAVATCLTPEYVRRQIKQLAETSATPLEDPRAAVEVVSSQLQVSEEEQDAVLNHFIKGGDLTAGGLMHAVTSAAQTAPDADRAYDLEAKAVDALTLAASL